MLIDTENLGAGEILRTDICVIGSGPAGMTLAHQMAERGADVILIEAGGWDWEGDSQDLYIGTWDGDEPYGLDGGRLRHFGGTSGHWAGFSRPLDAQDFIARDGFAMTGWPITAADLDPYLPGAADILEVAPDFGPRDMGQGLEQITFQQSPPVRFGEKYRDYVETAANLRLALNTAAVNALPDGGGGIEAMLMQTTGGPAWRVEARYFVLAAGGIENSRLLRWYNEQNGQRLIANNDLIGRYWMEHPYPTVGEVLLWRDDADLLNHEGRGYFKLSTALQQELGVLSGAFGIHPDAYGSSALRNLIADLMCVAPGLGGQVMAMRNRSLVCGARVLLQAEQAPQADNRVDLGDRADALGIPEVVMRWRQTGIDREVIAGNTQGFAEALAGLDIGRLRTADWVLDPSAPMPPSGEPAAFHHMGGTRMSATPETGIVNADCRVHDIGNLYIAGSSIFTTGGCSNPTMPIVQFSLRLADHLEAELRGI